MTQRAIARPGNEMHAGGAEPSTGDPVLMRDEQEKRFTVEFPPEDGVFGPVFSVKPADVADHMTRLAKVHSLGMLHVRHEWLFTGRRLADPVEPYAAIEVAEMHEGFVEASDFPYWCRLDVDVRAA